MTMLSVKIGESIEVSIYLHSVEAMTARDQALSPLQTIQLPELSKLNLVLIICLLIQEAIALFGQK